MKDKLIEKLIKKEIKRQDDTLDLIASENLTSRDILEAVGSPLINKYSEGYPGKRYYPGNEVCDEVEQIAIDRGLECFKLDKNEWHLNVQPYSGSPANLEIYTALMEPGDTLMGMQLSSGGHLTHGHKVSVTGRFFKAVQFGVDPGTGLINFAEVQRMAVEHKPKVIVSGFTAYPRVVDFKHFYEIAKSVQAYHVVDMSHVAGLIAGEAYPSPFPYADVVMTTTHKTMRGPRGAVIFCRKELAEKIDKAVFPGAQGGPHNNVTAGKAIMFYEAMQPEFKKYAKQIVKNSSALSEYLTQLGFNLITGGSDSHLILVDVRNMDVDGMTAEKRMEEAGIIANRNTVPGDPSPFKPSGVRLGTASLTSRGMKEQDMKMLAKLIFDAIKQKTGTKENVLRLCRKYPASKFLK